MATMVLHLNGLTPAESLDHALVSLRLTKNLLLDTQRQHRAALGLFMDSRIEDVLKELDDAIEHLECQFCNHASTALKTISGVVVALCERCADDYGPCWDCKQETKFAEMVECDGKLRCVECEAARVELEHGFETAR